MNMFSKLIPTPEPIKPKSRVQDLKSRLDWGEPALTIIDVRGLEAFNACHILGAIGIPMDKLVERVPETLEPARDIYLYAETEEETAQAAALLREAGYLHVAELIGGLAAWRAVGYPVEAISAIVT
ncbi:MAG: rhodanese-like domain-containing protein [Limnoraphis robusta]|nr:rhodanese-like domain-containing protein [Limnoraphis robusta]MEA5497653.1 rhodanese-like domain-containing protein [Limnoraphis robusta BA-68 BA1]MEA5519123.1 rhodanese-like domain-containing protein [Limnoraphis robusta CCNP1315]MEA5538304.1 rhodanese-like domain-containing protein [Limnoraphis robusta Tam1]MEA5545912.1 rhodanese-like domain-containing protein [Limnoraphis robusta CCNP1324]